MQISYKVEQLKTCGYIAYCPEIRDRVFGGTEEEAIKKLKEATGLYLEGN